MIVFAKAPVPGYAKTRLAVALGEARAARLAARMLEVTLDAALTARIGPVELCCAPDRNHSAFAEAAARIHDIRLAEQGGGDLGARMHRALCRSLRRHRRALLIGTDAPGLDVQYLRAAARALRTHPAVFVPACDGGYVLTGLSQPMPALFANITWSTKNVMKQTRARLRRLGLRACELPPLADVDEAQDLVHVPSDWLS